MAEKALQAPEVYLPGVYPPAGSGNSDRRDLLGKLAAFGGERGKALAAQYEK